MVFLLVFSGVVCMPVVQAQQSAQTVDAIVRWNRSLVGVVIAKSARDNSVKIGTVFLTNRQGFAITAGQIVAYSPPAAILLKFPGCPSMQVLSIHHSTADVAVLRVAQDLCTLKLASADPANPFPENRTGFAFASAKSIQEGQQIVVIGFPPEALGSGTATVTTGTISAVRPDTVQIQAPIASGSGGAPVLNMFGQLVGMVRGTGTGDRPGVSPATPLEKLQSELCFALHSEGVLSTSEQFLKCLP